MSQSYVFIHGLRIFHEACVYVKATAITFAQGQTRHGASKFMDTGISMPNVQGGYNGMALPIPCSKASTVLSCNLAPCLESIHYQHIQDICNRTSTHNRDFKSETLRLKVKVKQSLYLIKQYAMKTNG
jgi:hypothetical protein